MFFSIFKNLCDVYNDFYTKTFFAFSLFFSFFFRENEQQLKKMMVSRRYREFHKAGSTNILKALLLETIKACLGEKCGFTEIDYRVLHGSEVSCNCL